MNSNWGSLYSASNNIHSDMPPIMSDGRNYSSWLPEEVVNENIKKEAGITSNWEYRQYLQSNASNIMSHNSMAAVSESGFAPVCKVLTPNAPFLFMNTFDTNKPSVGYSNGDLKNQYLTSEQLNARMVAPIISTKGF
jgi:hypothetical protein